jgi:hypothetical protein
MSIRICLVCEHPMDNAPGFVHKECERDWLDEMFVEDLVDQLWNDPNIIKED